MKFVLVSLVTFTFITACGYSKEEEQAALVACDCAQDKSIFGIASCISNAADSLNIDASSLGYDRAVKDNCPEVYQRLMDFSKGK